MLYNTFLVKSYEVSNILFKFAFNETILKFISIE